MNVQRAIMFLVLAMCEPDFLNIFLTEHVAYALADVESGQSTT